MMPLVDRVPKTMEPSEAQCMPAVEKGRSETLEEEPPSERETLRNSVSPDLLKTMFLPSGEKEN